MRSLLRCTATIALLAVTAAPTLADATAFRFTELLLRDPHTTFDMFGCRDVTDTPFLGLSTNGAIQTEIDGDADGDGNLDLSLLIVFDPLNQAGSGGFLRFEKATCTDPHATTICDPDPFAAMPAYSNLAAGTCLSTLPGTLRPYSPAVVSPTGPCFVTAATDMTVDLGSFLVPLESVQIAATYVGSPAATLANGLIRGFLVEAVADTVPLPAEFGPFAGNPLSSAFPGGTGNCSTYDDRDVGPGGASGWWVYLNFVAEAVDYVGPSLDVADADRGVLRAQVAPNPFRQHVSLAYDLPARSPIRVAVFDLGGRLVAELATGRFDAGRHTVEWDGSMRSGAPAPAGLYLIRLSNGRETLVRRVALMR